MKELVNLAELDLYDNKIKDLGGTLDTLVDITYVVHPSAWCMLGQRPTWNL